MVYLFIHGEQLPAAQLTFHLFYFPHLLFTHLVDILVPVHVIYLLYSVFFSFSIDTRHSPKLLGDCFPSPYTNCITPLLLFPSHTVCICKTPKLFTGSAPGPRCFPICFLPHIRPQLGRVGSAAKGLRVASVL